ncbi:MAG: hypothetical protein BAA03_03885 [Caldibacillus debilis]|nr:MAG: hypothetical protein BAA03_03885 [Caldibacillus debilis]
MRAASIRDKISPAIQEALPRPGPSFKVSKKRKRPAAERSFFSVQPPHPLSHPVYFPAAHSVL